MARKSVVNLKETDKLVQEAVEEFEAVSEMKYEIAKASYDAQDDDTRKMIDKLVKVLDQHATGHITLSLDGDSVPVEVEKKYVGFNTLYIVMDMLKTLALFDIRVGKYTFPDMYCSNCEAELHA
jgi:hypothetical protein